MKTIDDVIARLEQIITKSEKDNDPSGYFAALYQKVTIKVKEGIANNFFDDGVRMEQFDVVFAKRYIDAYDARGRNETIPQVWQKAFALSSKYWPIVLQHLLLGMNAHINFDLGIAAAEISHGKDIADLENDFNKINEILSSLVHEVENNLSVVWPALKFILKWTGKVDDYLVDFSMKLARDGAWKFANQISVLHKDGVKGFLSERDRKVSDIVTVVTNPGLLASMALAVIRLTEKGSVTEKIRKLKKSPS